MAGGATAAAKAPAWNLEALRTDLAKALRAQHPQADLAMVDKAFDLAVEAHSTQVRASGEPYVTHPIASAQILAELGIDPVAVTAALLHDVPEDTEYSLADVEDGFGPEVAHLVDGVTKLSKFSTHSHEQQQAENIRKMFLAMAEDIRVVLIKLADRLHNMRTLGALKTEKQQRIARQTMEIYAPLAERLGIWQIKWELEDLSFKALEPEAYRELAKLLDTRRKGRETYIERAIEELRPRLAAAGIDAELQGRPKHIYSIWKKMQRKSAEFGEIYDVYAIRLLVDEVRDCYAALGTVHALWRPIPGQFDDYIAVPKNNLYQSLHTAVIALDGKPLEIQIRTHAMHQVSARSASRPTGGTRRAPRPSATTTRSSPGCASSWSGSATSASRTRRSSSRGSSSTSSRTRCSCSRRAATSRTCRPARRRSTSRTGSTRTSGTARSARRSTTASCRWTTGSRTATSSRSSRRRASTARRATG